MKSEVYSWRLTPEAKQALEHRARSEGTTVAELLDRIVGEWLAARQGEDGADQARLHAAAAQWVGAVSGAEPDRAERARDIIRRRLGGRRAAGRPD